MLSFLKMPSLEKCIKITANGKDVDKMETAKMNAKNKYLDMIDSAENAKTGARTRRIDMLDTEEGAEMNSRPCRSQSRESVTSHVMEVRFGKWYRDPRWIILSMILACAAIGVSSYLVYQRLTIPSKSEEILFRYGSLFRTREEQFELEESLKNNLRQVRISPKPGNRTCSFTCKNPAVQSYGDVMRENNYQDPGVSESDVEDGVSAATSGKHYEYHGCCISFPQFFSPGRLRNDRNEWRRVVQFRNRRQYFVRDRCRHADSCSGCQCTQTLTLNTAIVVDYEGDADDDDFDTEDNLGRVTEGEDEVANYRLEFVKMDGACKCFNT